MIAMARLTSDDVMAAIDHGETIANRDSYIGSRSERTDDVMAQYLRAIALGLALVGAELEARRDD